MQSFLQYRSFKTSVKDQYERDRKKAKALKLEKENRETAEASDERPRSAQRRKSIADSSISTPATTPDPRDPEKAEQTPASPEPESSSPTQQQEINENENDTSQNGQAAEGTQTANTLERMKTTGTMMGTILTGIEIRPITLEISHKLEKLHTKQSHTAKTTPHIPPKDKVFVVNYESDTDPQNPHNWGYGKRICATVLIAMIGFIVGFASAVDSPVLPQAAPDLGVSEVVESLATGIFLIGFGVGALFAGPISETVGRNPVYVVTLVS